MRVKKTQLVRDAGGTVRFQNRQPDQPLVRDEHGTVRFRENAIVRHLLDAGGTDLNRLALLPFSQEDREQFAQLIGYSVCGFGELPYVSDEAYARAQRAARRLLKGK
jgi:hypothetical protein